MNFDEINQTKPKIINYLYKIIDKNYELII